MGTEDEFFIAQLVKHTGGNKVHWSFVFQGQRVVLTTHQLLNQRLFRRTVMEKICRFPPRRAPINHERWVGNLIANCIEDENAGLKD